MTHEALLFSLHTNLIPNVQCFLDVVRHAVVLSGQKHRVQQDADGDQ